MNFSRKLMLVAGTALLAACGDKVTVAAPTPPTPVVAKINSVDVAPSTATITAGSSIPFTAAVNADAGVTYTIAWSSSVSSVAVSSAGVVTTTAASVTPGAAICATATAGTQSVKGCATLVVQAPPTTFPATVSISSITTGGLNIPVNPANVAGQMDVTLNVNPGNQQITKVELLVGGIVAGSQTFTAAQAAALRYAADEAVAAQSTFPQITFSVNTACYESLSSVCNALKTTDVAGDPAWLNGSQAVSARVFTSQGGSASAASASATQTLTFNNVNTFTQAVTVTGTTATANNAAGYRFTKGDIEASIIPVSYTGAVLASMTVNFGAGVCNIGTAPALRTKAATAPAVGAQAWTATFANSGAAAAGNLTGFSYNPACGTLATGEGIFIATAQDATGGNFTTAVLPLAAGSQFRIDNLGPTAPVLAMTVGRRFLNWVNDLVVFNDVAANGGIIGAASADIGVGLSTTNTAVYKTTVGGNVIANAAGLAESIVNTTYSATATGEDLLGNLSAASAAATFGVDRTIPTFTAAALAADATVIAAPGGVATGAIAYLDPATLPAGPSTPSATPVRMTIQRRTTATASTMWNSATPAFNATGGAFSIGLAGGAFDPGATNVEAYYVVTLFVEDGAGNPSASVTRSYLYDVTAPTGPFTIPVMTASAGASNLFSASLADNLDLKSNQWAMEYGVLSAAPGGAGATLRLPATTFGSFLSFTTAATDAANYPLYRSMIFGGYVAGAGQGLLNVSNSVVDRANIATAFGPTAVPAVNLPAAATADPLAAAIASGFTYAGFVVSNAAPAGNLDISGDGAAPAINSIDLTATATGTVNTMLNPFTRVEFWAYDAGGTNSYRYIGQAATPSVVDNATNRVYTWTVNWNPDTYTAPTATAGHPIIAIGVTSTFDAVRTAANVNITTVP